MRGKGHFTSPHIVYSRITPAYAGKSLDLKWKAKKQQDHPRLCGEKAVLPSKAPQMAGSPPPMRGKAGTPARGLPADGITPAYAGKSIADFILSAGNWDHPRLCGEKPNVEAITLAFRGSPPPMRGKA